MPVTIAKPPPDSPALALTDEQVAGLLNVSPRTVWSLVDTGKLKAVRIARRLVRIPRAEVEAYLAKLDEQPAA